jgi:hypothetical protein
MKKFAFLTSLVLMTAPCFGALSGFYQGMKEVKEILDHSFLRSNLSQGHPISELKLVEDTGTTRTYYIKAGDSEVYAKLNYIKSDKCGPRHYEIEWEAVNQ